MLNFFFFSLTMNESDNEKVKKEDKFLEDKKEEVAEVKVIFFKLQMFYVISVWDVFWCYWVFPLVC